MNVVCFHAGSRDPKSAHHTLEPGEEKKKKTKMKEWIVRGEKWRTATKVRQLVRKKRDEEMGKYMLNFISLIRKTGSETANWFLQ